MRYSYEMKDYIVEHIPKPALYEAFAEEATELAHACLKMARILRGDNPTPVTEEEALKNVEEEYCDLRNLAYMLDIYPNGEIQSNKLSRWINRIYEEKELKT